MTPDLWRAWVVSVTLGELAGFAVPAVLGALTAERPEAVMLAALLGAGAVEGAVLGWAQARVLRRVLPALATGRYVAATAGAAVLAYLVGLGPALLGDRLAALPTGLLVAAAVVGGAVLLASIGTAQWLVLRRVLPGSVMWIPATAVAWAAGLLAFAAVTTPLWQPGQPVALAAAIGVLGGLVMGLVVAVGTGFALARLLSPRAQPPRQPRAARP